MKKKTRTRIGSILLCMTMLLSLLPVTALADGDEGSTAVTMTLQEFVAAVEKENGTYDGHGVVVEITPENGCDRTSSEGHNEHAAKTPNTPDRIQVYSGTSYAQYQRFESSDDLDISNVTFRLVPPDGDLLVCGAWNTSGTAVDKDNLDAELQLENSGTVSFTGCTFENVAVSPINSRASVSFDNCQFSGLAQYGIKEVKAAETSIVDCTFTDCSGGVYMSGGDGINYTHVTYTGNQFTNIGSERGAIQFGSAGDYSNATFTITDNKFTQAGAVFRQLNSTAITAANTIDGST